MPIGERSPSFAAGIAFGNHRNLSRLGILARLSNRWGQGCRRLKGVRSFHEAPLSYRLMARNVTSRRNAVMDILRCQAAVAWVALFSGNGMQGGVTIRQPFRRTP